MMQCGICVKYEYNLLLKYNLCLTKHQNLNTKFDIKYGNKPPIVFIDVTSLNATMQNHIG